MKKLPITALLLSGVVAASGIPAVSAASEQPAAMSAMIGDADADGVVGISDATALQLFLAQDVPISSEEQLHIMDADGSGTVTISDATELQRCIAELPHNAIIGSPCDEIYPPSMPTELTLNVQSITLGSTETFMLTPTADVPLRDTLQFQSHNPAVAAVSGTGVITAGATGRTVITCTYGALSASCTVNVRPLAQTLALGRLRLSLEPGAAYTIDVHIPNGTAAYYRRFFSENPDVAAVDDAGNITARQPGATRVGCELNSGARGYMEVTVSHPLRTAMVAHLRDQLGKTMPTYIDYMRDHSDMDMPEYYEWCTIFAWSALDSVAAATGRTNPVAAGLHVSDFANQARALGALHNVFDNDYTPKPGDVFTTSELDRPGTDGRSHIGYIESVDTDAAGKVVKVHTIEGNYGWEIDYAHTTQVSRGEWVPGVRNTYCAALVEYIDLEQLFAAGRKG